MYSIKNIISFLFVTTRGLYITKLPLSPIYFFMLFCFYVGCLYIFFKNKIYLNGIIFFSVFYMMYLLFTQVLVDGDFHTNINIFTSLLYFVFSFIILANTSLDRLKFYSIWFLRFSLCLLVVEAIYRLVNPIFVLPSGFDYREDENLLFYAYKINSIMYQDSNFVGIFIVVLIFFVLYLKENHEINIKINIYLYLLFLLLLLSISRAAIISTIFFIILYKVFAIKRKLVKNIFLIISLLLLSTVFYIVISDESFVSKIHLIDLFITHINNIDYTKLLIGVGYGNTVKYFGMGSHNFVITHIVESGLIGFLMMLILWISVAIYCKKTLKIMLPFLLVGMSLIGHAIPYMYTVLVLIIFMDKKNNVFI